MPPLQRSWGSRLRWTTFLSIHTLRDGSDRRGGGPGPPTKSEVYSDRHLEGRASLVVGTKECAVAVRYQKEGNVDTIKKDLYLTLRQMSAMHWTRAVTSAGRQACLACVAIVAKVVVVPCRCIGRESVPSLALAFPKGDNFTDIPMTSYDTRVGGTGRESRLLASSIGVAHG